MLKAAGENIIFMDADGATDLSAFPIVLQQLSKTDICFGSRAHLVATKAVAQRSYFRNFLMYCFHAFLRVFSLDNGVKDTQCGFKGFRRKTARDIFEKLHLKGWIFDVEVLFLANKFNSSIAEVQVTWKEISGSKLNVAKDSIYMVVDLLAMKFLYFMKIW